jgi:hypothetical protein
MRTDLRVAMTVVAVAATEATVARAGIATAARAAEGDHDGSQGDSEAQRLRGLLGYGGSHGDALRT